MTDADVALAVWEDKWERFKSEALPLAADNARRCIEASELGRVHPIPCLIRLNEKTLNKDELSATNKLMVEIFGKSH